MEGLSASMRKGLRGYWRRRGYEKLNGSGRRHKKNTSSIRIARKRRVWRIRIKSAPKLSFRFLRRVPSPKKLLLWLRDAYVNLMLGFANTRVMSTAYGGSICDYGTGSFVKGSLPLKEYDEKMIVEIYKSLMLAQVQAQAQGQLEPRDAPKQGQLEPRDAPNLGSEILHQRR